MEGAGMWLKSQAADFFHKGIQKNLFLDTNASIPA
jgi:hypothetical protein